MGAGKDSRTSEPEDSRTGESPSRFSEASRAVRRPVVYRLETQMHG
jgi:hypothetical protein